MKTLVIGLGNPILGDDGVGWKIAREVESRVGMSAPDVSFEYLSVGGISLMERMVGYERIILIDSLNTGQRSQGEVVTFTLDLLDDLVDGHSASAHDTSLKNALKLGHRMLLDLPDDRHVYIVAVEAKHVYDFGESLTPEVAAAVPEAVNAVLDLLETIPVGRDAV